MPASRSDEDPYKKSIRVQLQNLPVIAWWGEEGGAWRGATERMGGEETRIGVS